MARIIKEICKIRDVLVSGDDKKIADPRYVGASGLYERTTWKLRDLIKKKSSEPDYELDITSQDLRELASDIKSVLKRWSDSLDAETNTKWLLTQVDVKKHFTLEPYMQKVLPVMKARIDSAQYLTGLLNMTEYMAVFLYMIEVALQDETALKYTVRFEEENISQ